MQTLNEVVATYLWNAVWQATLLLLVGAILVRLLRSSRAALLHRVWVGCFLLAVALPALPLLRRAAKPAIAPNHTGNTSSRGTGAPLQSARAIDSGPGILLPATPTLGFEPLATPSPVYQSPATPALVSMLSRTVPALRILYFAGVLFALLRLARGIGRTLCLRLLRDRRRTRRGECREQRGTGGRRAPRLGPFPGTRPSATAPASTPRCRTAARQAPS